METNVLRLQVVKSSINIRQYCSYLSLHHQTSRHAHFIDHSEDVDITFVFVVLQESIISDESAGSSDAGRAMDDRRSAVEESVHFKTNLTDELDKRLERAGNAIVRPNGKVILKKNTVYNALFLRN